MWLAALIYPLEEQIRKSPDDRDNAFVLKKDVKIYGGFAGDEASLAERDLSAKQNASILSGDIGIAGDQTDNVYHVVISAGDAGSAVLNGFTISGGYSDASGGAVTVNGNTIYHALGGGIYNNASSPILMNLMILGNQVFKSGGGIYNRFGSSPTLTNVRISGNQAANGGGIYVEEMESPMILTNVIISGNQSPQGGGIYIGGSSWPLVLTNVTISGNMGNAIFSFSSKVEVRNSIIYGNTPGLQNFGDITLSYCLMEGYTDETNGNLNGQLSPEFVDPLPEPALSVDGDYQLKESSPVINAGHNDYYNAGSVPDLYGITTDLNGDNRVQEGSVDMGAYESPYDTPIKPDDNGIVYVTVTGAGSHSGNSWMNAAYDLQKAIESDGVEQVWVAAGTYQPAGKGKSFSMKKDVEIYGSFAGNEDNTADRQFGDSDTSILKGNGASVIRNDDNGLDTSAVLDGFKITGGRENNGGGMYNHNSSPTIMHCTFSDNTASIYGGGMFNENSAPIITNCIFTENYAKYGGGLVNNNNSSPLIINCLLAHNHAENGEAIYNTVGNGHLTNTTLIGSDNNVLYAYGWTFWKNCIVWGSIEGSNYNVNNSIIGSDKAAGGANGNIDARTVNASDIFTDFAGGDFSLKATSPAINAGTANEDTTGLHLPLIDLAGNPRIIGGRIDMGAFESLDGGTLPVTLHGFTGHLHNGVVTLQWQSGVESAFDHYDLEKSKDGKSYLHLATKLAKGSNSDYNYSGPQSEPTAYYRLKLTDNNGHSEYYQHIISLSQERDATHILIYPNPAKDYIHINVAATGQVAIYDGAGRLVKRQALSIGVNKVAVNGLSSGVYYAVVNGQKVKFVKK